MYLAQLLALFPSYTYSLPIKFNIKIFSLPFLSFVVIPSRPNSFWNTVLTKQTSQITFKRVILTPWFSNNNTRCCCNIILFLNAYLPCTLSHYLHHYTVTIKKKMKI